MHDNSRRARGAVAPAVLSGFWAIVLAALGAQVSAAGETNAEPLYLKIHPTFLVNLNDGKRILMLSATVRGHDAAGIEAAKQHMPAIRHSLLMMLSAKSSANLTTPDGQEATRKEALETVREVLKGELGKPGVRDLYFTDIIVE